MPIDTVGRYERMAVVGNLLRLSSNRVLPSAQTTEPSPCTYLVIHRRAAPADLLRFVEQLPTEAVTSDSETSLVRLRNAP
jgi:hypothetical protein